VGGLLRLGRTRTQRCMVRAKGYFGTAAIFSLRSQRSRATTGMFSRWRIDQSPRCDDRSGLTFRNVDGFHGKS
jgi:hypothetical protein